MRLILFDVDGTLTRSCAVDERCFVQAVADVLHVGGICTDWATYRDATDVGITSVVYVGDGVWDARAARRLGYAFVGIGDGAERLREEGASMVVGDLTCSRAVSARLSCRDLQPRRQESRLGRY
jgi:phosphoglycolate phosphatase-like HAD superfamily hydrolase